MAVEAFAQRLDDGNAPATAASKPRPRPLARAAAKISVPCTASKALLAVTTCLPVGDGLQHQALGRFHAADQLDDDVDVRAVDEFSRVSGDGDAVAHLRLDDLGALGIRGGNHRELNATAGAAALISAWLRCRTCRCRCRRCRSR